jgi:hypothetical protein
MWQNGKKLLKYIVQRGGRVGRNIQEFQISDSDVHGYQVSKTLGILGIYFASYFMEFLSKNFIQCRACRYYLHSTICRSTFCLFVKIR